MSFQNVSFLVVALGIMPPALAAQAPRVIDLTGRPTVALTETFSELTGFATIGSGAVVVADGREDRLVRIDLTTGRSAAIGRRGGGPLEYRVIGSLFTGRGDSAWMNSGLRLVQVTPDGKIARTLPSPGNEPGRGVKIQRLIGVDGAGALYFLQIPSGADHASGLAALVRWAVAAEKVDTMATFPEPKASFGRVVNGILQLDETSARHLEGRDHWLPMPDGRLVIVRHEPFRIDFLDRTGRITSGTAIPHRPIPVTAADRESHRKFRSKLRVANAGPPGQNSPASRPPEIDDADFVTTKPPFTAVRVSPEGEIWVLRTRPASDPVPSYDIFDRTGRLTARARLRPHSTVVGFGTGTVWVSREDPDDDLIHLERYTR